MLATESTVASNAYQKALLARRTDVAVYARACPLWVTLAEMGAQPDSLVEPTLAHGLRGFLDDEDVTVLLGCTHFPVFRHALTRIFNIEPSRLVDSASTTAEVVASALANGTGPEAARLSSRSEPGTVRFLATDDVARFRRIGKYFFGDTLSDVSAVDL